MLTRQQRFQVASAVVDAYHANLLDQQRVYHLVAESYTNEATPQLGEVIEYWVIKDSHGHIVARGDEGHCRVLFGRYPYMCGWLISVDTLGNEHVEFQRTVC